MLEEGVEGWGLWDTNEKIPPGPPCAAPTAWVGSWSQCPGVPARRRRNGQEGLGLLSSEGWVVGPLSPPLGSPHSSYAARLSRFPPWVSVSPSRSSGHPRGQTALPGLRVSVALGWAGGTQRGLTAHFPAVLVRNQSGKCGSPGDGSGPGASGLRGHRQLGIHRLLLLCPGAGGSK